ncbi:hypothetical protein P7B02_04865 [Caulobacter segnis]|uniref:DUF3617 domain-containing protein n=1 Tax=Caulobacter segnis TaxID=88688 RepID=UPI00240F9C40|nr:DUF3617 family protein [Caulobacter segnis]MDG2520867.1 hypothetical protein [Caulobacter segnis]
MRRAASVVWLLLSGLMLAACSEDAQSERLITPKDLPRLKPGLWRTVTRTGGHAPETLVQCIGQDHSLAQSMGEARARCPGLTLIRTGGVYMVTARCARDGGESLMRARFTGDFKTRMRAEMSFSLITPDRPAKVMTLVSEGRHEGPCGPGQAPGVVENGAPRR